ncbi:HNH endonuclease [Sulfitobacter phage phiCB2047-B]|uniref:Metallopeptidase domain protein n=1 Tax=Sulfitobacter phage phiCB2047-B TaxID=754046 RepID=M4PQP1_9CAUD|nr:HNH endonuclease [Sulfitobacter phage phiCB2047-B]AGH07420.1 hypothetical protein SUFG_00053 [Sulfitobacter phage phiCB2047-B]
MLQVDGRFVGLSYYVINVKFYWSRSINTACAGHGYIFFNPDFWGKLTVQERKTVIAHEIWHLILNHLVRGKGYDHTSYNIAADYVINQGLKDDGFTVDSKFGGIGICYDPKYNGQSTEQIYKIIHKKRKQGEKIEGEGIGGGTASPDEIEDLVKEAVDVEEKNLDEHIEKIEEIRKDAIKESQKQPGMNTGTENRILQSNGERVVIQKATYEEIFEDYLTEPLSGGKRTFMRPSRRQRAGEPRLKGKYPKKGKKNRLQHLVYALDVSGSISQKQANQFLKSAKTLKEKLNPVRMTVILWDTRIAFEKTFREDEKLDNIKVTAGGGTRLEPVYARVRQLNPEALVIFTDMCVTIPPKPQWETIWFVTSMNDRVSHVTYGDVYLIPES